jgi:Asp-tRNA(Asn)/Glu-tRNA(Gln) amidotransferase A subunit family amidase
MLAAAPLLSLAHRLRSGQLELQEYIEATLEHVDRCEPSLQALLPEPGRKARLLREAEALQRRFPEPASRPPLYGILLGVKDLFYVAGFPLSAGSTLPPEEFQGQEASSVTRLRKAGVLLLGKTVLSEFAYFEPGPTRNPHHLEHTPGGSSSGSAAAVAAGYCPLALGTQTIGSVIRPAAFCGIVGFKPSYGRIASDGLFASAPTFDTIGFFLQDATGLETVATLLCNNWQTIMLEARKSKPVLGVPSEPYLAKTSPEGRTAFEQHIARLKQARYEVRRVEALSDIEEIVQRNKLIHSAEMAQFHADWFARYEDRYRPRTAQLIRDGQRVKASDIVAAQAECQQLRQRIEAEMTGNSIDLWISPAAPGPAPEGITTTGDPIMNLPWTQAGLPAVTIPAGHAQNGLPLGLQLVGKFQGDERLVSWIGPIADIFLGSYSMALI